MSCHKTQTEDMSYSWLQQTRLAPEVLHFRPRFRHTGLQLCSIMMTDILIILSPQALTLTL